MLRIAFRRLGTHKVYFDPIGRTVLPQGAAPVYKTGQYFIAKDYEYRGVVLFPQKIELVTDDNRNGTHETAYMVLCDERDTMDEQKSIDYLDHYMEDGQVRVSQHVDIVSHTDILPIDYIPNLYSLQHHLFSSFFKQNQNDGKILIPKAEFYTLIDQRKRLLKKYVKTTDNIRISIIPDYLGDGFTADRRVSGGERYNQEDFLRSTNWWQYTVTMENLDDEPFELIERQLRILDRVKEGSIKTVRGRGVVGKHPIITADIPFKYTSTMPLPSDATKGCCWGRYIFESRLDGRSIDVEIPKFDLSTDIIYADFES